VLREQVLKAMEEAEESDLVLVLTTEGSLEKAQQLATSLLEKALVACVSFQPIQSHYLWEGRITRSEEVQMVLKTHLASLEGLYQTVMDLHSYETPEWITLRGQTRGAYGAWCVDQLTGGRGATRAGDGPPVP
jgi:periplasmic divalent cation tolerance protein